MVTVNNFSELLISSNTQTSPSTKLFSCANKRQPVENLAALRDILQFTGQVLPVENWRFTLQWSCVIYVVKNILGTDCKKNHGMNFEKRKIDRTLLFYSFSFIQVLFKYLCCDRCNLFLFSFFLGVQSKAYVIAKACENWIKQKNTV